MACRGFFECVLKLLNLVVMAVGLAMAGYGAYLLVVWLQVLPPLPPSPPAPAPTGELVRLGRPMLFLLDVSLPDGTVERLSSAWFIFAFIGVGVILFITSIFGCAGASTRSGCCLSTYSFLIILFILVELAVGCFIFFDHNWKDAIPVDKTGNFDTIYSFLKGNWRIAKWVALGAVVFEALLFTVALIVQSGNQDDYDSDDEYIGPRSGARQPLVNKQTAADPRVPNLDYRPIRNDAWSQRMRDKLYIYSCIGVYPTCIFSVSYDLWRTLSATAAAGRSGPATTTRGRTAAHHHRPAVQHRWFRLPAAVLLRRGQEHSEGPRPPRRRDHIAAGSCCMRAMAILRWPRVGADER